MSTDKWEPIAALTTTDAYKLDHRRQYPPGTTRVYSNWTNRKSRIPGIDSVVHFGLQAYIQHHLEDMFEPFFAADEQTVADLYYEFLIRQLGSDRAGEIGVSHILALHRLGYLPLRICGLPEGTLVPIRVPSFTVENTHDDFAWLTNYFETPTSTNYWLPSTSATLAKKFRKVLDAAAERTGATAERVDFQAHDFSARGMSSFESSAASAAGHLLSFRGTDTCDARRWIDRYYGGDYTASSIPATEHSVMSAGTAWLGEFETFERLLDLYPTGTIAIVSDTYDLWRVCTEYLPRLKDKILARDGKLVIRPDSGDPVKILLGDGEASEGSPAHIGVVQLLWRIFGGTFNEKQYQVLDPHIGVIYGDSINLQRAEEITECLEYCNFVSTTVTLGVGSFTYQYQTRDTFGSAMKATWAEIDGKGINIFKDPITDDGTKKSATGRLAVAKSPWSGLRLIENAPPEQERLSRLQPIWENGKFLKRQSFPDIIEEVQ